MCFEFLNSWLHCELLRGRDQLSDPMFSALPWNWEGIVMEEQWPRAGLGPEWAARTWTFGNWEVSGGQTGLAILRTRLAGKVS